MISLFIVPGILAVLIILIIVGVKSSPEKGGEDVIKNVYVYLVLFATLMMTIGGSVGMFMALADIVAPTAYYQSFEDYKMRYEGKEYPAPENNREIEFTEEELREKYDVMVSSEKQRQVDRAKNALVKSLGWIIIPLPVFIYFQRKLVRN